MGNFSTNQIIAKEGILTVLILAGIFFLFAILQVETLAFASLILTIFAIFIFRNPERESEEEKDPYVILSPIDGKIENIETIYSDILEKDVLLVKIKSSILDVGIVRSPFNFSFSGIKKIGGLNFCTSDFRSKTQNNRILMRLDSDFGECGMTLIGGFFTKKIALYSSKSAILKGKRMGFGNAIVAELFLPLESRIKVAVGDEVFGAESALGYFTQKSQN